MDEMTTTRTFQSGDRVVCLEAKPFDAAGNRRTGVVLHVFRNGELLVDMGYKGKHHWQPDARMFAADQVVWV